jgi:hypothetical protein
MPKRASSPISSPSDEEEDSPAPSGPTESIPDEDAESDEELENLKEFSAFNSKDLLDANDDDESLRDDASVGMELPAIEAAMVEEDAIPPNSIISGYLVAVRERIKEDGKALSPKFTDGVN